MQSVESLFFLGSYDDMNGYSLRAKVELNLTIQMPNDWTVGVDVRFAIITAAWRSTIRTVELKILASVEG